VFNPSTVDQLTQRFDPLSQHPHLLDDGVLTNAESVYDRPVRFPFDREGLSRLLTMSQTDSWNSPFGVWGIPFPPVIADAKPGYICT